MTFQTLIPERAIRRLRQVDLRIEFSLLATAAAIGGMLLYANSFAATRPVIIVTRDLQIGGGQARADLEVAQVRVDDATFATAVPGDALGDVLGLPLTYPALARQILMRAQVSGWPRLASEQLTLAIEQAQTLASAKCGGDRNAALLPSLPRSRASALSSVDLDHRCQAAAEGRL